jgi:hypothetical protein
MSEGGKAQQQEEEYEDPWGQTAATNAMVERASKVRCLAADEMWYLYLVVDGFRWLGTICCP